MRQSFLAYLFVCFIFFTAVAAQAPTVKQTDFLKQFLDLPAPPPRIEVIPEVFKTKFSERAPEFFDRDKVPPDDAPLEDLLQYWVKQNQSQNSGGRSYNLKPSEKTLARILGFCEEHPEFMYGFLNLLPSNPKVEIAESVKRIYDKALTGNADYSTTQIKRWLTYQSNFFAEELLQMAQKVKDKDNYTVNHRELLALARVDWEKAVPILERLAGDKSQPVSATAALWAYYAHAIETGDEADVSKYRRQLQEIVENRTLLPGHRDMAMDALVVEKTWDGREDWYVSLLSDETLYKLDRFTGLTTILRFTPPEKMIPAMANLVDSKNPAVRKAAIRNLVNYLREDSTEAVRALLPWLTNPGWMSEIPDGRAALIAALGRVDMPETVPVLINILLSEEEFRAAAAEALIRYKDPRAVPALKIALAGEKSSYRRITYIRALDECGGITDDEKMSALETYATMISTPDGATKFNADFYQYDENNENSSNTQPLPLALVIGYYVSQQSDPSDGLAMRAVERLKQLRKTKPPVADALASIMQKWKGRIIFIERLRQIRAGEADVETVLSVLAQREEIRKRAEAEVFAMRASAGTGRGIAACLADDETDAISVLRQKDADAQTAMLGCARLLRFNLPLPEVGAFFKSANKTLALAAERYLETEDSTEARTLILANHQGEAVILGARHAFVPDTQNLNFSESLRQIFIDVAGRGYFAVNLSGMDKNETALRDEIKANPDLLVVYGLLPNAVGGQKVIRVFKDKIVFTDYEDEARYRQKTLSAKEYEDFYRLILEEKIDSLKPAHGYCEGCEATEFVMFGKNGGRRVFFTDASLKSSPVKKVLERFASFGEGNLKLHYRLGDRIKGLEVLLADEKFEARAVWKNGADFRVLVEDLERRADIQKALAEEFEAENNFELEDDNYQEREKRRVAQEKRREENKYAHFFWRSFENGGPGAVLPQPAEIPYLFDETQFPETEGFDATPRAWQVRAGNYEIHASHDESGLYKVNRAQAPVKFKEGNYDFPIVTGDENWVVATKTGENWGGVHNLVRINLKTGKEFPVNLPAADTFKPIAFIASQNKVLIYRARGKKYYYAAQRDDDEVAPVVQPNKADKNPSPSTPEYYLLDAATGAVQSVKGEFRPVEDQTYRPLQATAAPGEFWAALYDKKTKETAIGRYSTNTFAFQTVIKLPEIKLNSMDIWIDEKAGKVYFVYEGHLLAAPLK